jgi:hypothetical protein
MTNRVRPFVFLFPFAFCFTGCSLFEPREAEPPTQSGVQYEQQTFPLAVISNLQKAIAQKDDVHYIACFTNPARNARGYTFVPSADAVDVYASVLRNWSYDQELMYFRNLKAKARQPNGFSSLTLTPKDSVIATDSREYGYDYDLRFEHTDPTFTQTVRGTLRFTLINDNSEWTITRWVDLKTTTDLTWSSLKGKFSN